MFLMFSLFVVVVVVVFLSGCVHARVSSAWPPTPQTWPYCVSVCSVHRSEKQPPLKPTCVLSDPSSDLGGRWVMVTHVFQKVPTTSVSFVSIYLSIYLTSLPKKQMRRKAEKQAIVRRCESSGIFWCVTRDPGTLDSTAGDNGSAWIWRFLYFSKQYATRTTYQPALKEENLTHQDLQVIVSMQKPAITTNNCLEWQEICLVFFLFFFFFCKACVRSCCLTRNESLSVSKDTSPGFTLWSHLIRPVYISTTTPTRNGRRCLILEYYSIKITYICMIVSGSGPWCLVFFFFAVYSTFPRSAALTSNETEISISAETDNCRHRFELIQMIAGKYVGVPCAWWAIRDWWLRLGPLWVPTGPTEAADLPWFPLSPSFPLTGFFLSQSQMNRTRWFHWCDWWVVTSIFEWEVKIQKEKPDINIYL